MSRTRRVYYINATYHVSIRGNNRQMILKEREDKIEFLKSLAKFKDRFKFKLFGFVLMDNHTHLVISANGETNISRIMQALTLSYSQKFRHKYNYTGYVWQGRFKSKVIEDDIYIIECLDYIHNNPVRAKLVKDAKDYPWSSYHLYHTNTNPLAEFIQLDKLMS